MLKLFYAKGACSLASHILLEELNLPYEAHAVDLKSHKINGEDYYSINPNGAVPALQLPSSEIITQNGAILFYIAEQDPKHQLLPRSGTLENIRCHEWVAFLSADVHKLFSPLFAPQKWVQCEIGKNELLTNCKTYLQAALQKIDRKLKSDSYAVGENFTLVDPYLLVFYRWAEQFGFDVSKLTNYSNLTKKLMERSSVISALAKEV